MTDLNNVRAVVNKLKTVGIYLDLVGTEQLTVRTDSGIVIGPNERQFITENRAEIIAVLLHDQRETKTPIGDHDKPFPAAMDRDTVSDDNLIERELVPSLARFIKWDIERYNGKELRNRGRQ